jgi:hypothetical protein
LVFALAEDWWKCIYNESKTDMKTRPTKKIVTKLLDLLSYGLTRGIGEQKPGEMCVEAAVCAAYGLPHGDEPPCVDSSVREFKIRLNDLSWSSNSARAEGMKALAIAQLGSNEINEQVFVKTLILSTVQIILPIALRNVNLEKEAINCERAIDLDSAAVAVNAACMRAKVGYELTAALIVKRAVAWARVDAAPVYAAQRGASAVADAAGNVASAVAQAVEETYGGYGTRRLTVMEAADGAYDNILILMAQIGVEALQKAKSPGCKYLKLIPETVTKNS